MEPYFQGPDVTPGSLLIPRTTYVSLGSLGKNVRVMVEPYWQGPDVTPGSLLIPRTTRASPGYLGPTYE